MLILIVLACLMFFATCITLLAACMRSSELSLIQENDTYTYPQEISFIAPRSMTIDSPGDIHLAQNQI